MSFRLLPFLLLAGIAFGNLQASDIKPLEKSGVVLTFDDSGCLLDWSRQIPLFKKYNAKVTFFLSRPQELKPNQIKAARMLRDAGHEIAAHGALHIRANQYTKEHGMLKYLQDEIEPADKAIKALGFTPTSFAYPMSSRTEHTDAALQKYYRHLRGGQGLPEGKTLAQSNVFFTPLDKVASTFCLVGRGFDRADDSLLEQQIYPALERLTKKNEILVLYAHNITSESVGLHVQPEMLEKVLKKASELGLSFYTYSDLPSNVPPARDKEAEEKTGHFRIEQSIIREGYDRERCFVHARVGLIPETNTAVLTAHPLRLTGSDVYYTISDMSSTDRGKTWTPLKENPTLARVPFVDGTELSGCDPTPSFHAKTGKLLLTGHTVIYKNDTLVKGLFPRKTYYSVYDTQAQTWGERKYIDFPKEHPAFDTAAGSTQRWDLEDGTILLPVYGRIETESSSAVSYVLKCSFDGETLRYVEHGSPVRIKEPRGACEPSLVRFRDKFYLTIRNDVRGYVAESKDGLNYSEPTAWCWDETGEEIGNYNTQQHWVRGGNRLYLVYTRNAGNNDHVFRHRAPLFIAEVNPEKKTLIRSTERIVVPERGARLGNFGVCHISENESWVVVTEWMQTWKGTGGGRGSHLDCEAHGANNAFWLSRITWLTDTISQSETR